MKQETIKRRASWLTALMAGAMLVSCSNDMQMPSGGADGSAEGTITFNISLPSTEKVVYGGTRAIHDEAEYNVTTLDVYEYDVNTGFVAKHTFSAADGSIRPAGEGNITGEYTVTITEDLAEVGSLRRFYFVANNANGVTPATGTDYETGLRDEAADIALTSGSGSSVLCPEGGIAMSGLAVNTETNGSDITIKSGAMNNVHVDLTRIVGRVDLYSNAENLVITGARMEKASAKGYLMDDHAALSTLTPGEIDVLEINANAGVAASGEACLPVANSGYSAEISAIQQYNDGNGTGVRKAFYMYERDNSEGDCTQIVVSYALADGTTGEAVVPFTKTDETTGAVSYVNIERNHLYKVVLGNGEDITPGSEVEVKIIDEPWNVVDLPVVVEGYYSRKQLNSKLAFARLPLNDDGLMLGKLTKIDDEIVYNINYYPFTLDNYSYILTYSNHVSAMECIDGGYNSSLGFRLSQTSNHERYVVATLDELKYILPIPNGETEFNWQSSEDINQDVSSSVIGENYTMHTYPYDSQSPNVLYGYAKAGNVIKCYYRWEFLQYCLKIQVFGVHPTLEQDLLTYSELNSREEWMNDQESLFAYLPLMEIYGQGVFEVRLYCKDVDVNSNGQIVVIKSNTKTISVIDVDDPMNTEMYPLIFAVD